MKTNLIFGNIDGGQRRDCVCRQADVVDAGNGDVLRHNEMVLMQTFQDADRHFVGSSKNAVEFVGMDKLFAVFVAGWNIAGLIDQVRMWGKALLPKGLLIACNAVVLRP